MNSFDTGANVYLLLTGFDGSGGIMKVNIQEKLEQINDHWNPRIVGELNGQQIRLVKIIGDEFAPHQHEDEDEMFFVIKGGIKLEFENGEIDLKEGEFYIVPKGTVHRPLAEEEAHLMMFVTASNVNTGNIENEFTLDAKTLERS
jgi:mannose-6-phosphate isomerase-like protein (cupin superfamily)